MVNDISFIPDKEYFRIGEVAQLVGVETYVLRYWETEFNSIKPVRPFSNQRLYRRKDVELILLIKDLLYQQKYTIEGAREKIKSLSHPAQPVESNSDKDKLKFIDEIRDDLNDLKQFLKKVV